MSSADLYEDGFPHGTKEGYDRGCRGSACPGALEAGQTCATAKSRYNGDYGYRKLIDSGMTPEQIRDAEQPANPAKPLRLVEPKPIARPKLVEPTPVAAVYRWPEDEKQATEPNAPNATAAEVAVDPTTGKTIPLELHGSHKGYWRGCRDIACPGIETVGKSCRAALNEYVGEKKRERIARAEQAAAEPVAPAAIEEPAEDVTPDLSASELTHVTAFGLHEPEQQAPALAEWEIELLGMTDTQAVEFGDLHEAISERDDRIRDLERELRWYEHLTEKKTDEQQRVVVPADGGRTVTITIVVGG